MSAKKNKQAVAAGAQKVMVSGKTATTPLARPDNTLTTALKEESLVWMLTIICSVMAYIVVANIVHSVYHPDINALKNVADKALIDSGSVRPEPVEAMLFRIGVVVILASLFGFYRLFSGMKALKEQADKLFSVVAFACVAVLVCMIYADFAAQNPYVKDGGDIPQNSRDFIGRSNFDFYFDGLFLGSYVLVYTLILVPLIATLFFLGIKKYNWESNSLYKRIVNIAGYLLVGATIFACVSMSIFSFPYSFENKYNFNAVYYSMTQVHAGSPMLVDGFTNTYGLYPQFLNLVFQVIGLSVYKFSMVMAILIGTSFVLNYYTLKRIINNRIILTLGMLTVIFFPFLDFKLGQAFDCNFAFYPIRYIIPSFTLFMASLYLKNRSQLIYWITMVAGSFLVLWNPEIGIVCYLSWLAMHTYNDSFAPRSQAIRKIVFHWVIGIAVLVIACFVYKYIIYAIYGGSPDLSLLFSTVLVFGKVGFNMLPMVLVHPWNLMAVVVILGFMYTISKWYKKEDASKSSLVFLISVISIGYFIYFQGRSHDWQLAQASCVSLMLLTFLGDRLWAKVRETNVLPLSILFGVFLFAISFSLFELVYDSDKIHEMVSQEDDKEKNQAEQQMIEESADFIQKNTHPKEKIHVMSALQYEGLYFDGSKRKSAFNPGYMDMFTKADLSRLEKLVMDSSFNVFIQPPQLMYAAAIRPCGAVAATYELKTATKNIAMLTKRKLKTIPRVFFSRNGQLVHRKYTDDTGGFKARIDDATGLAPVTPNPAFSVEALFRNSTQIFQFASLVGNMTDSAGFLIYNILGTPNYFFGVNGKGVALPIPADQWAYVVMNIFPDHAEVFQNGVLVNSFALPKPMRQSQQKLYIGNIGLMHYFLGPIAEVAVNNNPLDAATVQTTWNEIKPEL